MTPEVAPPTHDDVMGVLRGVVDPELGADVVSLGMVPDVRIADDGVVTVTIKLTIGGCPLRADIKRDVEGRLELHPGVTDVRIEWGEMTPEERSNVMSTARRLAQDRAPHTAVPTSCRVIAVASGKGGVGKSSVTANLAVALAARGHRVGVLDADIWGFSMPRLLGIADRMEAERVDGSDKPKIIPNRKQIGPGELEVVSTGFLVDESTALMWRGLMLTKAVEQFLADVAWGDLDYLLIDMPPGTGDVQMGLARLLPRASMVIVTTPARAAQKVAQRAADMAARSFLPVIGVIENMSAFVCDHGETYALFGEGGGAALAADIDAPLIGRIPLEPTVAAGNDDGVPVAWGGQGAAADEFRAIAERIVTDLLPPTTDADVDMAGCSARLLDAVNAAFDD
ncbi:MAG: Mrp/NBP35 family ATP-binding protein [Ilumatobacteraceae bacterium]